MSYSINWDIVAIESLVSESDFILNKWNQTEVNKFENLVKLNLERLSKNPEIGKFIKELNAFSILISKQTTLYYNFDEETKVIDLYLFWNNLKNPNDLLKLL